MSSDCQENGPLKKPVILDLSGTRQAAAGHLSQIRNYDSLKAVLTKDESQK